ncbi:MAG: type II toxin-antitoxin system RelE family toxin [Candidatus Hadarchaeia archaeon]
MSYDVLLHPKADKFLEKVDKNLRDRIRNKLKDLESDPKKGKRLSGSEFRRLRIGDYRVIYETDQDEERAIVLFIGHRKNVYDDFSKLV